MRGLTPALAGILSGHGQAGARGGMGRRGLGHPRPAAAAGELPTWRALVERGRRGVTRRAPVALLGGVAVLLTGLDPAGHGVFDILEHQPGATRRLPVSSRSILAPTWPQRLSDAGRRVVS